MFPTSFESEIFFKKLIDVLFPMKIGKDGFFELVRSFISNYWYFAGGAIGRIILLLEESAASECIVVLII